jgi:hypothetical protein
VYIRKPNIFHRPAVWMFCNRDQNQPLTCHGTKDWHVWSDNSCFWQDRLKVDDTGSHVARKTRREEGGYWTESVRMWPEFIWLWACVINSLKQTKTQR